MKKAFLIIGFAFILASCNSNNGVVGGESYTQDGPVLIDATLSLKIVNNRPAQVTDYFYFDDTVNVYTLWENVEDTQTVSFYFVDPDGYTMDSLYLPLLPGEFSTSVATYVPLNREGDWEVLIFLNDDFERSLLFTLSPSQGK